MADEETKTDDGVTPIGDAPSATSDLKDKLKGEAAADKKEEAEKPAANKATSPKRGKRPVKIELDDKVYRAGSFEMDLSEPDDEKAWQAWADEGRKLDKIDGGHQWWRGDWFAQGEARFGDDAYGYFDSDEYDDDTISQFVRVANAFPEDKRRHELSWTHHKSAAGLPTARLRAKALNWAIKNGKNGKVASDVELRAYVRTLKGDDKAETEAANQNRKHYRISFEVMAEFETLGDEVRDAMLRAATQAAKSAGLDLLNLEANPAPVLEAAA